MTTDQNIIAAVYDIERALELAFKTAFTAAGITAFTSQMVASTGDAAGDAVLVAQGYDIIDFQKDRPRAEIFVQLGAGQQQWLCNLTTGEEMEQAWAFNCAVTIVSAADIRQHAALRTMSRFIIQTLRGRVNNVALKKHCVNHVIDGGTAPTIKSETGDFETRLTFSGGVSIQRDAFATLFP